MHSLEVDIENDFDGEGVSRWAAMTDFSYISYQVSSHLCPVEIHRRTPGISVRYSFADACVVVHHVVEIFAILRYRSVLRGGVCTTVVTDMYDQISFEL